MNRKLVSDSYRAQQEQLHAGGKYGVVGATHFRGRRVAELLNELGAKSLLDYGCGSHRSLLKGLDLAPGLVYEGYDPCVPEFAAEPTPAELVVCIDVLEHVEPELLDNVLDHLAALCDPYGYFTIHCGPALKVLPDGRNAHLIQQAPKWWVPRLQQRLELLKLEGTPGGFAVLMRSRV